MTFLRSAVVGLILSAPTASFRAAESPALRFDHKSLALPPLSLRDIVPGPVRPPASTLQEETKRPTLPSSAVRNRPELSSRWPMPVLRPDETVAYKMVVVPPDPAVDFKLVIKNPDREAQPQKP